MTTGKRSLKFHAAVYALGNLGQKMIGFIMLPIYTRKLTTADYGIYELLAITTLVLGNVMEAGLRIAIIRFYHKYDDARMKRLVVSTAFRFMSMAMSGAFVVLFLGAPLFSDIILEVDGGTRYFRLIFLAFCLDLLGSIPFSFFQTEERSLLVVSLSLARLALGLSLNILFLVVLDMGLEGILWSSVITAAVFLLAWGGLCIRRVGFGFDGTLLRSMVRYGLPLVPATLSMLVIHYGDRYFLKHWVSLEEVGVYALAYKFGMLSTTLIATPFGQIWGTRGTWLMERGEFKQLASIFDRFSLLLLWAWVLTSLLIEDVLAVLVGPEFRAAYALVPYLCFAYVLRSWSDVLVISLHFSYRTKRIAVVRAIAALVSLALYATLIPSWGGMGAAAATLGTFLVLVSLVYVVGQRACHVPYDLANLVRMSLVAAAVIAACQALPMEASLGRFVLLGLIGTAYPLLADWRSVVQYAQKGRSWILRRVS